MNTTGRVEKYEIRISSVIREIQEIQKLLQARSGISQFSRRYPEKIEEAVLKMTEAQKLLYDAIGLMLNSGNAKKTHYLS